MTEHITCEAFAAELADYLERDLTEPARAALESHAARCGDCGAVLADVRKLRDDAAHLPVLSPSRELWEGIASRIDAPVIPIGTRVPAVARPSRVRALPWIPLSAAAAALIMVTAGLTYYGTMVLMKSGAGPQVASTGGTPAAPVASTSPAPQVAESNDSTRIPGQAPSSAIAIPVRVVNTRLSAEQTYDLEITRLKVVVDRRRSQLDPATVVIVEKNLKIIDDAIAQCRAALVKDPASRFLIEALNTALDDKVELLRTVATLPSRT
jgi:putative zinc finger protein